MRSILDEVIEIVARQSGIRRDRLSATWAIDQDIRMVGADVADLAEALSCRFGEDVWTWPWQRFAQLDEALSLLAPLTLVWQLLTRPMRGTFSYPSSLERLELGHIAAVIDEGHWVEP